jgi:hypothetical protein
MYEFAEGFQKRERAGILVERIDYIYSSARDNAYQKRVFNVDLLR